jgi:hypothetical protein
MTHLVPETAKLAQWRDDELALALEWHRANMEQRLTPDMEQAFTAGFIEGWLRLRAAIQMHRRGNSILGE